MRDCCDSEDVTDMIAEEGSRLSLAIQDGFYRNVLRYPYFFSESFEIGIDFQSFYEYRIKVKDLLHSFYFHSTVVLSSDRARSRDQSS